MRSARLLGLKEAFLILYFMTVCILLFIYSEFTLLDYQCNMH